MSSEQKKITVKYMKLCKIQETQQPLRFPLLGIEFSLEKDLGMMFEGQEDNHGHLTGIKLYKMRLSKGFIATRVREEVVNDIFGIKLYKMHKAHHYKMTSIMFPRPFLLIKQLSKQRYNVFYELEDGKCIHIHRSVIGGSVVPLKMHVVLVGKYQASSDETPEHFRLRYETPQSIIDALLKIYKLPKIENQ